MCLILAGCTPEKAEKVTEEPEQQVAVPTAAVEVQTEVAEEKPAEMPEEPAPVKDALAEEMEKNQKSPDHWTNDLQKQMYDQLFEAQELDKALEFRNFIESLAQYHHNEPVYEYNPVFLCYEKYPEILPLILEVKPELFTRGNMNFGSWSKAPIVYVLENLGLEEVKFYFENNIPFLDVREDLLFGTLNRGGPRFGIGGNILTYAKDPEVIEYMISQGIPAEVEASEWFSYSLRTDTLDVHSTPGNDTEVIGMLTKGTPIKAISVLTYRVDGSKWMKISFNDTEGWIPDSGFNYDSGI